MAIREDRQYFSTADAAEYLGYKLAQSVKYHIYSSKSLAPDALIGHELMFTKATLDHFRATHRSVGRPRQPDRAVKPESLKRRARHEVGGS